MTIFIPTKENVIPFESDFSKIDGESLLPLFNNVKIPRITNHFDFTQKKIGSYNDNQTTSMNNWIDDKVENNKEEFILKIDIEGSEFETLLNLIGKNLIILQKNEIFHQSLHYFPLKEFF